MTSAMKTMAQAKACPSSEQLTDSDISSTIGFSIMLSGFVLILGTVIAWVIGRGVTPSRSSH